MADRYQNQKINGNRGDGIPGIHFWRRLGDSNGGWFCSGSKAREASLEDLQETYELEYGKDTLEIHEDSISKGDKVLILDDVLATGGTAAATIRLVEKAGGEVVEACFLIHYRFLNGQAKIEKHPFFSIIQY